MYEVFHPLRLETCARLNKVKSQQGQHGSRERWEGTEARDTSQAPFP